MFVSMHIPDDPSWREDPAYSFPVAGVLTATFKRLRGSNLSLDTYLSIVPTLLKAHEVPMALVQRQHLAYALAQGWTGLMEYPDAVAYLDHAGGLSAELGDTIGVAECAYLRGSIRARSLAYTDASADFALALQTLDEASTATRSSSTNSAPDADPALRLYILLGHAGAEFMLDHHDRAGELLDEAGPLVQLARATERENATRDWLRSLILRWSGAPGRALDLARKAADLLDQYGNVEAQGRIHGIVAETALDIAEHFTSPYDYPTARDAYLVLAAPHAQCALDCAHAADDPGGVGLAYLAIARLRRVAGRHLARLSLIEDAVRIGRQRRDPALLSQAYISHGHELAASGHPERARNRYIAARQLLEGTDIHALDLVAERALYNLSMRS